MEAPPSKMEELRISSKPWSNRTVFFVPWLGSILELPLVQMIVEPRGEFCFRKDNLVMISNSH